MYKSCNLILHGLCFYHNSIVACCYSPNDQINGGLKEVCEPMVKNAQGEWVEYKSVNFAAQMNAKLDIADTLNKHYGTNLPLILDQAESVTEPLAVSEQLIRLIVSADDKNLRVETAKAA